MSDIQRKRDELAGEIAIDVLSGLSLSDTAPSVHAEAAHALENAGFDVYFEYPVARLGARRNGRIDIVAYFQQGRVAIEIDARKPRKGSLEKLLEIRAFRIIALRGVQWSVPEGIDAAVCIGVHEASPMVRRDKRTVNRSVGQRDDWGIIG